MTNRHKFMLNVFSTKRQKQVWSYCCPEVPVHFSTGQGAEVSGPQFYQDQADNSVPPFSLTSLTPCKNAHLSQQIIRLVQLLTT